MSTLDCTLLDLSSSMLKQAEKRVEELTSGQVKTIQGDVREINIGQGEYKIVISAAVLHHLREYGEWTNVFEKIYDSLVMGVPFGYLISFLKKIIKFKR